MARNSLSCHVGFQVWSLAAIVPCRAYELGAPQASLNVVVALKKVVVLQSLWIPVQKVLALTEILLLTKSPPA
ncbi:hypothetical protein PC129_g13824 [Phytophthora cactorum]|uniref:Uncharacterized protein n=1 Tax=Phytophthora cactorum TaxID=29920 RepID=A0A8T1CKC1_9STRA|nr:hypothetical protein Pcac1_g8873 [Phytophthora cactorum]KAG2812975.1 hypothetical protein PC112_g14938 [Phytophthora cactorum]KAG2813776.1 hypothetical protein PC111_g14250 [Phytophthora cactorum]KAG2853774.1 hypothetical protein PC113_g13886 [Phytophthora cactorum]KAG2892228.1 hypothetical protein PC114_g16708 [Phytophthora cactorum]